MVVMLTTDIHGRQFFEQCDLLDIPVISSTMIPNHYIDNDNNSIYNVSSKPQKIGFLHSVRRKLSIFHRKSYVADFRDHQPVDQLCFHSFTESTMSTHGKAKVRKSKLKKSYCCGLCDDTGCLMNIFSDSDRDVSISSSQICMSPKITELHFDNSYYYPSTFREKIRHEGLTEDRCQLFDNFLAGDTNFHKTESLTLNMIKKSRSGYKVGNDESVLNVKINETEYIPKAWNLTHELVRLSKFGWYWGPLTRNEAEEKLASQCDGAFLVRDSSDERYLLSLTFRSYGRTFHTRIEHCNGMFSFYSQPDSEGYPSIVDLIERSMTDSQTGTFCYSRSHTPGSPSFPVRLINPVSRFARVRSLQYLCRFVIRQYTRVDFVQNLPLPSTLKDWIERNQY